MDSKKPTEAEEQIRRNKQFVRVTITVIVGLIEVGVFYGMFALVTRDPLTSLGCAIIAERFLLAIKKKQ